MTSKAALFALLAAWGIGTCTAVPAAAGEASAQASTSDHAPAGHGFIDRIWRNADMDHPGALKIFLSDGTLVQDSSWETHRLCRWRMTSETGLAWNEDGVEIEAEIVSVGAENLVLGMRLDGRQVQERFVAMGAPWVCPDQPA